MMDRLLDNVPLHPPSSLADHDAEMTARPKAQPTHRSHAPGLSPARAESVNVLPIFFLQQPGEPCEDQQEQHHPDTQSMTLNLCRFTHIAQKRHRITHEAIVLLGAHPAWGNLLKMIKNLLGCG